MDSKDNEVQVDAKVEKPAPKQNRRGKGSSKNKEAKFRAKKNEDFQQELQATLLKRLKITDPTNLNAVQLQSSIPPAKIPITLRGLPRFVFELWQRMKAIGTRPFSQLATEENYAIFLKCIMYIAESRLTYAQMKCEAVPPFPLSSIDSFTEMQLRTIKLQSSRLPFPLIMFMEAIGNFTIRKQMVVPVEMKTDPDVASGAISLMPTSILKVLEVFQNPVVVDNVIYTIAQQLDLPKINWVTETQVCPATPATSSGPAQPERHINVARIDPLSIEFWRFPKPLEWLTFNQVIASMESKPGFLLQFDVSTGQGSSLQMIRYPDPYDPEEEETLYYMNDEVPEFEEKLAGALLLGCEYRGNLSGRFSSSYTECYKHGSLSQAEIRHAVIWSN